MNENFLKLLDLVMVEVSGNPGVKSQMGGHVSIQLHQPSKSSTGLSANRLVGCCLRMPVVEIFENTV